jgi:hypothetical protein
MIFEDVNAIKSKEQKSIYGKEKNGEQEGID